MPARGETFLLERDFYLSDNLLDHIGRETGAETMIVSDRQNHILGQDCFIMYISCPRIKT